MALINKSEIEKLAGVHDAFCITICIPTHRAGQEMLNGKDQQIFKQQLKSVKNKLSGQELNDHKIERLLKPASLLLEDGEFWRHQSDGLAVFISDGIFEKYTVPVYFEAFNYVANDFYIKPLLPLFSDDGRFYMLILSVNHIQLFEATQHIITEITVEDLVPERVEEVAGYDYEQKSLQFRTQQGGKGEGIYHGHGEARDKTKDEISRYFRAAERGITRVLNNDPNVPLVLYCQDNYFAEYKKLNTYRNLYSGHLSGNPAGNDIFVTHEKAWDLIAPYFQKQREAKKSLFRQHQGTGKASSNLEDIIPAALNGRVDTLFVQNRADIYGVYDPEKDRVNFSAEHEIPNVSLLNLAATKTFIKGGNVYLIDEENMPDPTSPLNALYRF